MLKVDIKSLLLRLNPYLTNNLQAAAGLSVSRTHYEGDGRASLCQTAR